MGQPGMRVTVDAAMRARDVSRPGIDQIAGDSTPIAPVTTSDAARPDSAGPSDGDSVPRRNGEHGDVESRPQRDRLGKVERRRLSKRHARAHR